MTTPEPRTVRGRCPACQGESLFLGSGGYVTCYRLECPRPEAATQLLEDTGCQQTCALEAMYEAELRAGRAT